MSNIYVCDDLFVNIDKNGYVNMSVLFTYFEKNIKQWLKTNKTIQIIKNCVLYLHIEPFFYKNSMYYFHVYILLYIISEFRGKDSYKLKSIIRDINKTYRLTKLQRTLLSCQNNPL